MSNLIPDKYEVNVTIDDTSLIMLGLIAYTTLILWKVFK